MFSHQLNNLFIETQSSSIKSEIGSYHLARQNFFSTLIKMRNHKLIQKRLFSKIKSLIEGKIQEMNPSFFEVIDESWMHEAGKETHFNIHIVSDEFIDKNLFQRDLRVFKALKEAYSSGVITSSLLLQSPEEYEKYRANQFIYEYPQIEQN